MLDPAQVMRPQCQIKCHIESALQKMRPLDLRQPMLIKGFALHQYILTQPAEHLIKSFRRFIQLIFHA